MLSIAVVMSSVVIAAVLSILSTIAAVLAGLWLLVVFVRDPDEDEDT